MKFSPLIITTATLAGVHLPGALAHPGMGDTVREIERLAVRDTDGGHSTQLLGDLRTLPNKSLTRVGKTIKNLLTGGGNPESRERYLLVPPLNSRLCKKDTCCVWKYISDELQDLFRGEAGRCTKWARFAVRMGFHDAATWTLEGESLGGGADGSIVLSDELTRGENKGLEDMGVKYREVFDKWHNQLGWDITMADLIQMGSNIAAVVCPLGPRIRSFVGRKDNSSPAPDGLLPDVHSDADTLINLFKDKTIGPDDLVALIGAHTTSQQNFVDVSRAGDPQDSTPGVWDVLFYRETLGKVKVPERVFKFPSDIALSQHPLTKKEFEGFAGNGGGAQRDWNEDYARAYIRLSLLGVDNLNDLTECTKALPQPVTSFRSIDQSRLNKWLQSDNKSGKSKEVSKQIEDGESISFPENLIPTS